MHSRLCKPPSITSVEEVLRIQDLRRVSQDRKEHLTHISDVKGPSLWVWRDLDKARLGAASLVEWAAWITIET